VTFRGYLLDRGTKATPHEAAGTTNRQIERPACSDHSVFPFICLFRPLLFSQMPNQNIRLDFGETAAKQSYFLRLAGRTA
jgi:hypothetical protein